MVGNDRSTEHLSEISLIARRSIIPTNLNPLSMYRSPAYLIPILLLVLLVGCSDDEDERDPRWLFADGEHHALEATKYFEEGNDTLGTEENAKAIESYRKLIAIAPAHPMAESALAHAFLLAEDYNQAIVWYGKAIARDSGVALYHTELGIAQINTGRFADGRKSLGRALAIDSSDGHREFITRELARIGLMANQYGEGYAEAGHMEQALEYRRFSLEVLKTAYGIGRNSALAASIADLAESIGDTATAEAYRQGE
jgi:tetratricopeptide (TPR) repeat protein